MTDWFMTDFLCVHIEHMSYDEEKYTKFKDIYR